MAILVASGAAAFAGGAFIVRRRRAVPGKPAEPRSVLELVSTIVAIVGGVAGVALAFIPGIGVDEDPAPEARMTVREVNARIPLREYAEKTTGENFRLSKVDQDEVGNVIWLEIKLAGLHVEDKERQTSIVPLWVGYPKSSRCVVRFRLLEGNSVRAIASTGALRGSNFRYVRARLGSSLSFRCAL